MAIVLSYVLLKQLHVLWMEEGRSLLHSHKGYIAINCKLVIIVKIKMVTDRLGC